MKLLLTSAGITNDGICVALVALLGKPIAEAKAVYVPTAIYAMPDGIAYCWQGLEEVGTMGWREFGVLELTALPSILEEHWLPTVEAADVIVVGGGNTPYLSYWMQRSGLAEKLPALLRDTVYVGMSAGSIVATHSLYVNPEILAETGIYNDDLYNDVAPPHAGSDETLRLVDFVIRPHLNHEAFPNITIDRMAQEAAKIAVSVYVIDDQTAIKVDDDKIEVISQGTWTVFEK